MADSLNEQPSYALVSHKLLEHEFGICFNDRRQHGRYILLQYLHS